jgi:hypothetical protein
MKEAMKMVRNAAAPARIRPRPPHRRGGRNGAVRGLLQRRPGMFEPHEVNGHAAHHHHQREEDQARNDGPASLVRGKDGKR